MGTKKYSLVLRVCKSDMTSPDGFVWPESGPVEALDWDNDPTCGKGLHGWLWGEGTVIQGPGYIFQPEAKWLVVKVLTKDIVPLEGKVKFPKGEVVFCGGQKEATDFLYKRGVLGKVIIGHQLVVGDFSTAVVGARGKATAGNKGTAIAGPYGIAIAGFSGSAIAGNYGIAVAGHYGYAKSGKNGKSSVGDLGEAVSGPHGESKVGASGTALSGERGVSIAGNYSIASAGVGGYVKAGVGGRLILEWNELIEVGPLKEPPAFTHSVRWDESGMAIYSRFKTHIKEGYIGEDGLLPNVPYRLDATHEFEIPAGVEVRT